MNMKTVELHSIFVLLFHVILLDTATAGGGGIQCGSSNVTCPPNSLGCVGASLGLRWECNMSSGWEGHPYTTCYTGAPHPLSSNKKNVLIIGDSVSNGYFMEGTPGHNVPDLVADIAVTQHGPWSPGSGGAGSTIHGLDCLDIYVKLCNNQPAKWDLIAFNFGLHNLDNTTAALDQYGTQLAAIADRLQTTGAKLQYHLTTPMMPTCCLGGPLTPAGEGAPRPQCGKNDTQNFYACDGVVQVLNQKARDIMAARGIPVVDLYSTVTGICGSTYSTCTICRKTPCSFHYTAAGYDAISQPIANAIRATLRTS
eukprot:m.1197722 g.1197722  ORF g.1197722 m.1197722 type:complete len:311 (-) comp24568_c0_seq5:271-1203(-)